MVGLAKKTFSIILKHISVFCRALFFELQVFLVRHAVPATLKCVARAAVYWAATRR